MLLLRSRLLLTFGYLVLMLVLAFVAGTGALHWLVADIESALEAGSLYENPDTLAGSIRAHAHAGARTATLALASFWVVALMCVPWLSRTLHVSLVDRFRALDEVIAAVAAGDRRRRADGASRDELGLLARRFNEVLDLDQRRIAKADGRLVEQTQLLIAVLDQLDSPVALVGVDGGVIVSTLNRDEDASLARITAALGEARPREAQRATELPRWSDMCDIEQRRQLRLITLATTTGHLAGWLAIFVPASSPQDHEPRASVWLQPRDRGA